MSIEIGVELAVLVMALAAAALSLRSAPDLDWERLLKVIVATVFRGEVEATGGDQEAWWAAMEGVVLYHPAGRQASDKLASPSLESISVPALEGERALVAALEKQTSDADRFMTMYASEASKEALLSDPTLLGAAYDPERVLSPGVGWSEIAAWTDTLQASLARRLSDVVLVSVGGEWGAYLSRAVPHGRVETVVPAAAEIVGAGIAAALPSAADRAVIIAGGTDVQPILQAMHADPALRDRVLCVISLGGMLASEWMDSNFTHAAMDTELNRSTAYMDIVDVDPEVPLASPWSDQCFPQPPVPPSGWMPIERVGLGPLPLQRISPEILSRSLWVLLAFRLSSR